MTDIDPDSAEENGYGNMLAAQRRAEAEQLAQDAARYRYIRAEFVQMHSPHMNGDHGWRFRHFRWTGNSFEAAIDKAMTEQPLKPSP